MHRRYIAIEGVSLASLARQLKKWFPLQGDRAHLTRIVNVKTFTGRALHVIWLNQKKNFKFFCILVMIQ